MYRNTSVLFLDPPKKEDGTVFDYVYMHVEKRSQAELD
jgi:hypothetical protein